MAWTFYIAALCVIVLSQYNSGVAQRNTLKLLLILPMNTSLTAGLSEKWETGQELLTGAQRTVNVINNDSSILGNHLLEIVLVNSINCCQLHNEYIMLPQLIQHIVHQGSNIIGAIGMLCPSSAKLVSELANRQDQLFNFPLVSGSPSPELYDTEKHPLLLHMLDSSLPIIEALVSFLNYLQWRRIAVVTDIKDNFYSRTAQHFASSIKQSNISISSYVQVQSNFQLKEDFEPKVVLVSTDLETAVDILCSASKHGFTWPTHAWIIHTHSFETFPNRCKALRNKTNHFNGIFIFKNSHYNESNDPQLSYAKGSSNHNVFYSSILFIALLENKTLHAKEFDRSIIMDVISNLPAEKGYHYDNTTHTLFSNSGVDIVWIITSQPSIIGHYDSKQGTLKIRNEGILQNDIPSDPNYGDHSIFIVIFSYIELIFCFLLVSTDLGLFIYFRREPEIKATSFSVTIFMFFSCYMIIAYTGLLLLDDHLLMSSNIACLARGWINILSLPGPLITATVLVKMIRIYRIFYPSNFTRIGKYFSNVALGFYILLLQIPNVSVSLLWCILDPYTNVITKIQRTNFVEIVDQCSSEHLITWAILLMCYNLILTTTLITVAVMTRKIRKKNFKDTKKVNTFVYIFSFANVFLLILWIMAQRSITETVYVNFVLYIGNGILIIITQVLLFLPKLYPLIKRQVFHGGLRKMKEKPYSLGSLNEVSKPTYYTSYASLASVARNS